MMRARTIVVAAVPAAVVVLLAAEVLVARRVERLDAFARGDLDGVFSPGPGEPLRVAWLGDSTGAGVGASSPDAALPRVVAARLGRPVHLTVLAESGARVRDVLEEQVSQVAALEPHWVIVGIGGNDVTHLTRRSRFRRDLDDVLLRINELKPEKVVVVGIGEFAATPLLAQPLRAIAGVRADRLAADQRRIARARGAVFVDVIGDTGSRFAADPRRYHARDGFHPSDDGYALWADAVLRAVRR